MIKIPENFNKIDFHTSYIYDCQRLQSLALSNGYLLSLNECYKLWDNHSYNMAAGWLMMPEKDGDLWMEISHKIEN
jgi:hypothetical protein